MNNLQITAQGAQTMTSLEIAEITGKKHFHIMRDIDGLNSEYSKIGQSIIGCTSYKSNQGKNLRMFTLTKKQCITLALGYSIELRIRIMDRLEELEAKFQLPNFNDPAESAIAWGEQYRATQIALAEKTELKEQLAIAEPKAKYCDTVLQSNVKLFTPTEICIELGFKSALMLNRVLNDKKIIRKVNGSWCLRAKYADTGLVFNKPYWKDEKILSYSLKWTEKGRALLHSLSLKE